MTLRINAKEPTRSERTAGGSGYRTWARIVLVLLLVTLFREEYSPVAAQPNPFGAPAAAPAAPARPAAGSARRANDLANPVIAEIRKRAPQGPTGLGDAIAKFMQINRIDLAAELIQQLVTRKLPDSDAAEIVSQISDARMFQLRMSNELTEDQRQVIASLQQAAARFARDPDRLKGLVPALAASDAVVRRAAERELLRGDHTGIAAIVEELLTSDAGVPVKTLADELRKFEGPGLAAVERAAHDAEDAGAIAALQALTLMSPAQALPSLVSAVYSQKATEEVRGAAKQLIESTFKSVPSFTATLQMLTRDLEHEITDWRKTPVGGEPLAGAWRTEKPGSIEFQRVSLRDARASKAAMAAERVARISEGGPSELVGAAELAGLISANPEYGLAADDLQKVAARWGISASETTGLLESILDKARELRLAEAAVAAIRLLARSGDITLTASVGSRPRPLVAAVYDAVPAIRLEAAGAIAELGIARDFVGSSAVKRRWQEIMTLPSQLQALVVEARGSVAQEIVNWLQLIGYEVTWTRTGYEALEAIQEHPGFDFAVVSSRPSDSGPIELVDRIRRFPKGGKLPILVIGPTENEKGMGLQDAAEIKAPSVWLPKIESRESLLLTHNDLFGNPVSRSFDSEVLLIQTRAEEIQRLSPLFNGIGYTVRTAPIGPDALQILSQPNNVGLIVISSQIIDREIYLLTQRIRENPRTVATPILVYGPHPYAQSREIIMTESWDAPTAWVTRIDSPQSLADWRSRLTDQETSLPLELADRERLRKSVEIAMKKQP